MAEAEAFNYEPTGGVADATELVTRVTIGQSIRYRVNVSTSVKGVKTYEVTVDGEGFSMEAILAKSDAIVAELDKRYPPQTTGDK